MAAGLKGSACPASSLSSLSLSTLIIFMFLSVMLMPYLDHTGGLMGVSRGTSTAAKSNNNSTSSSSSEIAGKKRENKKKGLYANSPLVVERGPAFVHQRVAEGATLLCVYYATWCPHCRTFVPTFVRLAKQYSLAYGALFVAVDCAEFEADCDRMKVTGYPTVAAYNFPRDQASVTGAFGSRIDGDGVPAYFKSFGMRRAGVDVGQDAEAVAEEDGAATKKSLLRWMEVSVTAKARTASPALRLADALASLEYLLVTETPRLVVGTAASAKKSMDALQLLLELVVALLPAQSKAAAWPDLEPEAALRFVREKRGVVVEEKAWKSGIQAALRPAVSKNLRSKGGGAVLWSVCGVSVSTKGKDQGHGYTCGLWLLMHFLTVAAAREGEGAAEAVLVQASIRATISQLFTCSACRTHFLRAFDDCSFNRCAQPNSPLDPTLALPRLQLWLYRLHNAVTARILVEKGGSYPETAALRKDARQVLWPDAQVDLGERRGEANIVEPHRVLEHVRGAYWDADWGPLTGLPTADSLLGLLS